MKPLFYVAYKMDLGCGMDLWKIFGLDEDGRGKFISSPVYYDSTEKIITTKSGSKYKVMNFLQNEEEFVKQIENDIKNGGYEVH